MMARTNMEKMTVILRNFINDCDGDTLLAIFDYTFGTNTFSPEGEHIMIVPGKSDEYGGIIEQEFKDELCHL